MASKIVEADEGPLIVHMPSLLMVVALLQGFFSWYCGFPLSTKISNQSSNSTKGDLYDPAKAHVAYI